MMISNGHAEPMPWSQLFTAALFDLAWWMLLGPAIVLATTSVARLRAGMVRRVIGHGVVGVATVILYFILRSSIHLPGDNFRLGYKWSSLLSTVPTSVGMYVIFLAGTLAVLALKRAAEREREAAALVLRTSRLEKQLVEAQLGVLRAQLHPHFLFNALHAISTLVDWRPREARRMIVRLSELLRLAFTLSEEREVSLSQELDWLEHYLELQQIRFGDRLSIEVRVAPDAMAARVPPLILQPLVENSLKHGIERHSQGGKIGIVAERDGRWLRLRVTDDGPGPVLQSSASGTGVGLRNTRERLCALYGDEQQLVLRGRDPNGAEVLVELPYRENPVAAQRPAEKLTG